MSGSDYLIETERCRLREFELPDAQLMYELNLHPDILPFTTDPPFSDAGEAEDFLKNYSAYKDHGMGRWVVVLKDGNRSIGWCGLKFIPEEDEVDVGFRLLPEFWGSGYAAETGIACCKYGFETLGLKRIVARIHKDNKRSIRVAEKMGMSYEKDLLYEGVWWHNFVLNR